MTSNENPVRTRLLKRVLTLLLLAGLPALLQSQPFGYVDGPTSNSTGWAGAINVTGWTLSSNTVATVKIYRDPVPGEGSGLVFIGDAPFVAGARPDVAAAFPSYPNNDWGWGMQILTNMLPGTGGQPMGNGTYTLHAIACDPYNTCAQLPSSTSPYSTSIVITVDNQNSPLPFGTIDTPAQGGSASGTGYINFGWVLTPQPNIVPIDGSTITVYIDGVAVGHPVYNQYRSDIASLFPGLQNSNGAVGYLSINTTQLAAGLHSIVWGVYDNVGHSAGIGSRNFSVPAQTGGGSVTMGFTEKLSRGVRTAAAAPFYVYNDNVSMTYMSFRCYYGADCTTTSCSISGSNVTAAAINRTPSQSDIAITADYSAAPGVRTLSCSAQSSIGPVGDSTSITVYDATPVVTSITHFYGGNPLFTQGEGLTAVRITGTNLGTGGTLIPAGPGVTYQYSTYWSPGEIDAYFNIDSTAVTQTVTVSVTSNDTGSSFQSRGDPQSQSQGSGQMTVAAVTPAITALIPPQAMVGTSTQVTIAGAGFGSGTPTVSVSGGVTVSGVSVNGTGSGITVTFTIPIGDGGGNHSVTVRPAGSSTTSNAAQFFSQIPTTLIRTTWPQDNPPGAPGAQDGYGPVTVITDGDVVNAAGAVLAGHECGVYRNLAYSVVDQRSPGQVIQGPTNIMVTESFSNYSGPSTIPSPLTLTIDLVNKPYADILDNIFIGRLVPGCLQTNENETFTQQFSLTFGGRVFPLTVVNSISRGDFDGTKMVTVTITQQ